ncbi:broad-complex core protein isoforms 1/2/3/4/5-like isoform X14 [Eriocheir sinensis]|uniref:broad-complex core protein isoforms 1/2/3/4/5-like isoform X14 n=1 Tax=Eriocheir sinensis TaxID=95602 RepID=UPI0021C6D14A|nr:broad-complex core protein isoforms 1/2/3/4/5-like isoform X14 [Eriocheir sinensis]XP_050728475.1 broad-complex core protein isoforms 1/2/3/4/5-like isoform X14 [Eriocheir sinensis]
MEELLSLKWNNHRSTFLHILGVLRDKQAYTDVTLACDGKFYSVHKLVLSTCSDYFCAMFDKTACKSPVIVLKDIKSEDLEALLDYMYLGEVNVRQSDLASLIKAAENLRIKGLAVPDDEPPKKGSVSSSRTDTNRREGGSGSPPSKRKRRDEGEDGREDVRPPPSSGGGLHTPPPPSSRPKSPISQRLSPSPLRTSQESLMPEDRDSRPLSSPAESPVASHLPSHQSSQQLPHQSSQSSQPLPDQHEVTNQYRGEETPTFVKVEMEEETDDMQRDSYNMSGDGYKEENSGGDLGGDLSNDLPEFLQQAASGALASTSASYHHAFAGPSGFQPDVSGWQGDSQSLPGSFSGLGFQQPSSQDNPPGARIHEAGLVAAAAMLTARGSSACSFPPSEQLLCGVCGRSFHGRNRRQDLERHMLTHTGEKPYQCPHCPHRTNRNGNLKTHLFTVHRDLLQAPRPPFDKDALPPPLPTTSASIPTRDLPPKPS